MSPNGSTGDGDLWLGIDIGTQSVKGMLVDDHGTIVAEGSAPLKSSRSDGRHEQDQHQWVTACIDVTAQLVAVWCPGSASRVRAIACCSTSGTLATATKDGAPTGPGIMYDDNRADALFQRLKREQPQFWRPFGAAVQPSWAVAKLSWLHHAGMPAGTKRILHQGDVVATAMVGHPVATDWSSALKTGYDLQKKRWPDDEFRKLGIDPGMLPPVVAPGTVLGVSSAEWMQKTGLPAGIPVVAGTTDGCASQIGVGAVEPGNWHSVLGTTMVFKGVSHDPIVDDSGVVYSHLAPDGQFWLPGGASNVGAGALSALLPGRDLDALALQSAELWESVGRASPVSYPLLGEGERFPLALPQVSGFIHSGARRLRFDHDLTASDAGIGSTNPGDQMVLASIFLGIACVERLSFDHFAAIGAPLTARLTTSGGGSRSPLWNTLRASMLNTPIQLMRSTEGSLGMAILAAWSMRGGGAGASLASVARQMNDVVGAVDPQPELVDSATEHFARFTAALVQEGWLAE